mgnify:CR=1 FL=1
MDFKILLIVLFIAVLMGGMTVIFGILYDNTTILLNGYSVFATFGMLALLIYSFYIVSSYKGEHLTGKEHEVVETLIKYSPVFPVLVSAVPLLLIILHLFEGIKIKIKYSDEGNEELFWSNIAVFLIISTVVTGSLGLLDKLSGDGISDLDGTKIAFANCGLAIISGVAVFIINKMNAYTKHFSTTG